MQFLKKFRRITYSTSYLPEVDGLRFLAIFLVVVVMHIPNYLDEKLFGNQLLQRGYWNDLSLGGGGGVSLFFVISSFILSLPFAKWYLKKDRPVSLKSYYLRRLTRLEPPYLIVLCLLFFAQVFVLHKYSLAFLFPHLVASAVYLHTVIYHSFSLVLPVAWSLEVEVQFYVLAPLIFLSFKLAHPLVRRMCYLLIIVISSVFWFDKWGVSNLLMYLHYFFMGILLADLYVSGECLIKNQRTGFVIGLLALAGFVLLPGLHNLAAHLLRVCCLFLVVHMVLVNPNMKKLFSAQLIVVIGGMCYSIYLLHFAIISAVGPYFLRFASLQNRWVGFLFPALLLILSVLLVSALFFLFVEKPFMRPGVFLSKEVQPRKLVEIKG